MFARLMMKISEITLFAGAMILVAGVGFLAGRITGIQSVHQQSEADVAQSFHDPTVAFHLDNCKMLLTLKDAVAAIQNSSTETQSVREINMVMDQMIRDSMLLGISNQ